MGEGDNWNHFLSTNILFFEEAASGRKRTKDEIIYAAYVWYGYMLKEVAGHLGVHYAAVSRLIKMAEQELNEAINVSLQDPVFQFNFQHPAFP
jgi:DNA-binding transcriptional regulator LsrR (DeoR family)